MDTIVQKIDLDRYTGEELQDAVKLLREGELVAFPTETVYGLGADALRPEAAAKIYRAKGRPSDNPLIVHIASMESLPVLAREIPEKALKLADTFWPGPLTMIFPKQERVPLGTTGGLDTVAVRMPGHPLAKDLIQRSGLFIAAPSANISGRPSPTMAEHVYEDFKGKIPLILDGGPVGIGLESTVVDMTGDIPVILRPGYITREMLQEVVGRVETDRAILEENAQRDFAPRAPGMKYKHYAPKGSMTIVEGEPDEVVKTINRLVEEKLSEGFRVGVIATTETKDSYPRGMIRVIGSRADEDSIARGLYGVLREFDDLKADYIYTEGFEEEARLGQAIMNRLLKAAGHQVLKLKRF
ncbi:L-threonylcarbamoyladenylate synthase [Anaerolentibacter hominis]|uniref:L-threonylcarbamoyladenylate synthase n=1 Tax=Anaerolentibacter hominis TaxID=3079009 RepID=UPI0031B86ED6